MQIEKICFLTPCRGGDNLQFSPQTEHAPSLQIAQILYRRFMKRLYTNRKKSNSYIRD